MARILRQVTVVRDGMHNAFTDLLFWQDAYWVSYSKATAHVAPDGEACISMSVDRTRFRETARIKGPGDTRDGKLIPMSDERLAFIFGVFNRQKVFHTYVAFSGDGFKWEDPRMLDLGDNAWLWRARKHKGRYYGGCYTFPTVTNPKATLNFLVSDDMIRWTVLSHVGKDEDLLNECDFFFQPDGEIWLVSRSERKSNHGMLFFSRPPYKTWDTVDLKTVIHCPGIMEHNGHLYVAGRNLPDETFPFMSRASLALWRLERTGVELTIAIPATGDCAYPGLIKDPEGRICMSYYSQHAYHMGVVPYLLRYDPKPPDYMQGMLLSPNDVYFAEIELA